LASQQKDITMWRVRGGVGFSVNVPPLCMRTWSRAMAPNGTFSVEKERTPPPTPPRPAAPYEPGAAAQQKGAAGNGVAA
jgi:hypothetical protein